MRRSASLGLCLTLTLTLAAAAAPLAGCQLIAGLGGEQPLTTGGSGGTGGTSGGTGGTGLTGSCTPDMTEACYTGPTDTKDKGLCKAGMATCSKEGTWGACDGEVVPQTESCASTDDEDCNGYDCAVWVKSYSGDLYANAIGVDGQGFVYAAIAISEGIDFGDGTPVVPVGNSDVVLVKYDKTGALVWKKPYPGTGDQFVRSMTVSKSGDIVLAGDTTGPVDFGSGAVGPGGFVAKLDADGQGIWADIATGPTNPTIDKTAIDSKGNVYAGGNSGSVDFGGGLLDSGDQTSFFVAKLDGGSGKPSWVKITKGGGKEQLAGIAVDPSDSLVLTGTWSGMYLGLAGSEPAPNDIYNCCGLDAPFLLRLDSTGVLSDSKMLAGYQSSLGAAVEDIGVDKFGVSTLVGSFSGIADFQSGPYDAGMGSSLFIVHDQTSGFMQWSKAYIEAGIYSYASHVAIDGHDNMVVLGTYSGALDLGGGPLPPASAYLLKLDKDGKFLWSRSFKFGDGGFTDMAAGSLEDETVLIGTYYQEADLGTGLLNAQQGVFVAKLGK